MSTTTLLAGPEIRFSHIQTRFSGVRPIKISHYYKNSISNYTSTFISFPNIGTPISLLIFLATADNIIATIYYNNIISYLSTTANIYNFTNNDTRIHFKINTNCELLMVGGGGGGV